MAGIYHTQPWTPRIKEVARKLIDDIHRATPDLEVLFMGAAALGLPGKNDIDLDILCDTSSVHENTKILLPVLGNSVEETDAMTVWRFDREGYEIDCILSDPRISHVPEQKRVFDALKSDTKLFEEYRRLKLDCDGLPYDEYEKRKKQFYSKIVNG